MSGAATLRGEGGAGGELLGLIRKAARSAAAGESTEAFAAALGLQRGVSGYVNHTVPVVMHAVLATPRDFRAAVVSVIRCGGDADTTGAIAGAIVGAGVGEEGIPSVWLDRLAEWPRTVPWMKRLGQRLAAALRDRSPQAALPLSPLRLAVRNFFFMLVVLAHGVRRLFPPY